VKHRPRRTDKGLCHRGASHGEEGKEGEEGGAEKGEAQVASNNAAAPSQTVRRNAAAEA
jgi:hypothetical protein